ncbi:MAG: hypothetical protein LBU61_00065 [Coriobacteriales bacterium]|jgi:hypothetical protein|nr:hypothetical protein [Coriobacteriales bacterium]
MNPGEKNNAKGKSSAWKGGTGSSTSARKGSISSSSVPGSKLTKRASSKNIQVRPVSKLQKTTVKIGKEASRQKAMSVEQNRDASWQKVNQSNTVYQTETGQRNSRISLRFVVVVALILAGLAILARCLPAAEGVSTLAGYQADRQKPEDLIDPLAISKQSASFTLLAVSPDGKTIGYTSELTTGAAGIELLGLLGQQGWQQCEMPEQELVSSLTSPLMLSLEQCNSSGVIQSRMMIQLFPFEDGCSIVITVYK